MSAPRLTCTGSSHLYRVRAASCYGRDVWAAAPALLARPKCLDVHHPTQCRAPSSVSGFLTTRPARLGRLIRCPRPIRHPRLCREKSEVARSIHCGTSMLLSNHGAHECVRRFTRPNGRGRRPYSEGDGDLLQGSPFSSRVYNVCAEARSQYILEGGTRNFIGGCVVQNSPYTDSTPLNHAAICFCPSCKMSSGFSSRKTSM